MPAATNTVSMPAGDVVGIGTVEGAVSTGETVDAGVVVDSVSVTGTGVSGGVVTTKVCISTAEEPYGYSADFES